jgi:hypothetical protein
MVPDAIMWEGASREVLALIEAEDSVGDAR